MLRMFKTNRGSVALSVSVMIAFSGVLSAGVAHAGSAHTTVELGAVAQWLASTPQQLDESEIERKRELVLTLNSQHGRGSYICSPSGFGQRSKCFDR